MNREIKFRGKVKWKDDWKYGSLLIYTDGERNIITEKGHRIDTWNVDPSSVGQLIIKTPVALDKFGPDGNYADFIEIYEDDIVEARCEFCYADGYKGYSVKIGDRFVVTSYKAGFCAVPIDIYDWWVEGDRIPNTCRVINNYYLWNNHRFVKPIGNIHDNSELLKTKNI